jgi:hypothetical protein
MCEHGARIDARARRNERLLIDHSSCKEIVARVPQMAARIDPILQKSTWTHRMDQGSEQMSVSCFPPHGVHVLVRPQADLLLHPYVDSGAVHPL